MEYPLPTWVIDVPKNTVWETVIQIIRGRWKINGYLDYFTIFLNHIVYPKIATE